MSREINPFGLRMPPGLREELEAAAEMSGRSLNAEAVTRLQQSFEVDVKGLKIFDVAAEMRDQLTSVARELEGLKVENRLLREALIARGLSVTPTRTKPRARKR